MSTIIKILLALSIFIFTSLFSLAFANDNIIKFKLEIKPNQQKVEAKIDGNEHKQIQIRAEYVKLNTVTNNYHIKVTITNNSGQILYHQLALIDQVEHSEVKYPDSTTDYIKNDDSKQITKTLPYYNYGNIKPNQATPREWYLSNTGKEEIEVEGYIINKEIPVVLDPKIISQVDSGAVNTLIKFLTGFRDNDVNMVFSTIAGHNIYLPRDLHQQFKNDNYDKAMLLLYRGYINITSVTKTSSNTWTIGYKWNNEQNNKQNIGGYIEIAYFDNQYGWLIIEY